jgi:hypothetical protein
LKRYWIRVLLVVVPILALIGGWVALQQQPRILSHAAASHPKWTIQNSGNTQLSNNVLNAVAASSEDNV